MIERIECPSCGGAGGGPFGPAGSAWDDEQYVCPRCKGEGKIALEQPEPGSMRPGLVKAQQAEAERDAGTSKGQRKATG